MSKKVLIITDDYPPKRGGGAAIIAETHALAMDRKGYEVVVVTTVQDKNQIGEFEENSIRVIRLYSKYKTLFRSYLSLYNPFLISKLKRILKKERPEIIHAHNIHYYLSYYSLVLARKYAKVVFITIHDSMPFHYSKLFPKYPYEIPIKSYKVSLLRQLKDFKLWFNPFRNMIIRHYLRIPDKIFAVSSALKDALADNGIENVEVINNGIDIEKWVIDLDSVNEFKKRSDLFGKKVVMFCGRLNSAKGGSVLIRNMPNIIKQVPNTVLLIVGEKDREVSKMLEEARKANVDKYLVFTGKLDRRGIIDAYGASNVLVVPSLCFDWFPTVNLEAMSSKLPVIATCFGGSPEVISHGENGYVVNPYHENEIVESVVNVLKDEGLAHRFGAAGYERVKNKFSIEKYIDSTIYWYNQFL